jgi:hypothetical protein
LGGAIRRYGDTVLYQGSLQLPGARQRAGQWEDALRRGCEREWGAVREVCRVPPSLEAAWRKLDAKYRTSEWNRRR